MATALENTTVTYEDLASIEQSFDDVEVEIMRTQNSLLAPLYTKRTALVSQIPNFWPLVLEQAPQDIDQYIQPSDSALLLSSLTSLEVSRFEPTIDPRSVSITLKFKENEHFSNEVLEKKFWYRKDSKGFSGLVSEPVAINWKSKDKDLTGGVLDLVQSAWAEEQKSNSTNGKGKEQKLTPAQKQLKKKIETTATGGFSFFAWFGYIGRRVSAEESAAENEKNKKEREAEKAGEKLTVKKADMEKDEEAEEDDDLSYDLEIFPDGDDLAVAISEDLWPGALKYFTQAQEADALSDMDFESDDDENESDLNAALEGGESDADEDEAPPVKKQKRKA